MSRICSKPNCIYSKLKDKCIKPNSYSQYISYCNRTGNNIQVCKSHYYNNIDVIKKNVCEYYENNKKLENLKSCPAKRRPNNNNCPDNFKFLKLNKHNIKCCYKQKKQKSISSKSSKSISLSPSKSSRSSNKEPSIIPSRSSNKEPSITPSRSSNKEPLITPSKSSNKEPSIILSRSSNKEPSIILSRSSNKEPSIIPSRSSKKEPLITPSRSLKKEPSIIPLNRSKSSIAITPPPNNPFGYLFGYKLNVDKKTNK